MPYFPAIRRANWHKRYQLGGYRIDVITDCESVGHIQYAHVALVFQGSQKQPCYAVASEVNAMAATLGGGSHFLGVFPGEGHVNMGNSNEWADLDHFTAKALEMIAKQFKITDPPQEMPLEA